MAIKIEPESVAIGHPTLDHIVWRKETRQAPHDQNFIFWAEACREHRVRAAAIPIATSLLADGRSLERRYRPPSRQIYCWSRPIEDMVLTTVRSHTIILDLTTAGLLSTALAASPLVQLSNSQAFARCSTTTVPRTYKCLLHGTRSKGFFSAGLDKSVLAEPNDLLSACCVPLC
ncbi:hypothetical protein BCR44DRAFT_33865 [Catenaria anguillulae PL171]|uniref:Uncharacterized protein n=1 Tax=Catenaria anguillulae PL171 TaxID=765915 RepID=A0A1Y2HQE8_9FUNG|nr:hypothetical protein BCR44DRAFT_33865 [Catenaria anguillulae PL171]